MALACSAGAFARQRGHKARLAPDAPSGKSLNAAGTWKSAPATPETVRRRIEAAAVKYGARAPLARIVLYDIGYPRDTREYASLDGHAVVLLTALSQERGELPIRRVYVAADGREVELKLLRLVLSEQAAPGDAAARAFGRYRADALYLLPVYLRQRAGELLADFDKNRTGLKVAAFGTPLPGDVNGLGIKPPTGAGPLADTLEEFIRREYPSFFEE
jgi:hypothetical protein